MNILSMLVSSQFERTLVERCCTIEQTTKTKTKAKTKAKTKKTKNGKQKLTKAKPKAK